MKWCFIVNEADFLMEFLGKLAHQVLKEGDECLVLTMNRIAEYDKKKFFPKEATFISKVDWCLASYDHAKKDFGGFSWKEFFPILQRWPFMKFSFERSLDIISQLHQFFDFVFQKEKPHIVISESLGGFLGEIASRVAQKHHSMFVGINESFMDRISLDDIRGTNSKFQSTFASITEGDLAPEEQAFIEQWIGKFLSHAFLPFYTSLDKIHFGPLDFLFHYIKRIKESGRTLLRYFYERNKIKRYDVEDEALLSQSFSAPWRMIRKQFRIERQKRFYRRMHEGDQFFLYPLQYQPETSTSVFASYYVEQAWTIRNIASVLPIPYKLYVKEHPIAIGTKSNEFYESLRKIPNVMLIDSKESIPTLLAKCSGVVTLTSTVGLEAAMSGKPAYVLGQVFYEFHPMCRQIINFDDLQKKIRADLLKKSSLENLKSMNVRFIASRMRTSVAGRVANASSFQDSNDYSYIYQEIKKLYVS